MSAMPWPPFCRSQACGFSDAVFWAALDLYRRYLPSAAVVTFPGVGHHPAIEEPEAFLHAVRAFLHDVWPEARSPG